MQRNKTYDKYKPSGIDWLGDVPEHWGLRRLRFSAKINPAASEIRNFAPDVEVSFVPMEYVNEYGGMRLDLTRLIEEVSSGFTYFREGDVTFAKITPCFENGKGSIAENLKNGVGFGTTELHVIRPDCTLSNRFLFYLTISRHFRELGESEMYGAGGQKRVPTDFVKDFPTLLPPIEEQQAIVVFLDRETRRIDELIEKKRQFIDRLAEKRTALISHAVTKGLDPTVKLKSSGIDWLGEVPKHWDVKALKYIAQLYGRIGFRGYTTDDLVDEGEGAITLSPSNMVKGKMCLDKCSYISWEKYYESPEIIIEKNDVLIVKTGSTFGKVAHVRDVPHPMTVNPQIAVFKKISCSNRFFFYYIGSPYIQGQISISNTGSTIPTMTQQTIMTYVMPLPPKSEQEAIVYYLDGETEKINNLMNKVEQAIKKLQEYRSAIISAAVTGKIDVREVV